MASFSLQDHRLFLHPLSFARGDQDIHFLFHFISTILTLDGNPQRGFCSLVAILTPVLMISNLSWIAAFWEVWMVVWMNLGE